MSGSAVTSPSASRPPSPLKPHLCYDPGLNLTYYEKNANMELPQASCTKIMTALLAVERGDLNEMVTIGKDAQALVRPDSSYMGVDSQRKAHTSRPALWSGAAFRQRCGGGDCRCYQRQCSDVRAVALMNQRAAGNWDSPALTS